MKKIAVILFVFAISANAFAQSVEITDVKGFKFRGVFPILSGTDMQADGYYTYYQLDKDKGVKTIEFSIINKEVSEVFKNQVEMHKWAVINNTVFNGEMFLLSWEDWKNKQLVIKTISKTGEEGMQKELPVEKRRELETAVYADKTGNGFYLIRNHYTKKAQGYSIERVDNKLNQIWQIEDVPEKGIMQVLDLVNTEDRFVIWQETGAKGKLKPFIVCYDAKTGAKIYEKDGYDGVNTILYNELRIDDDGSVVLGGAYVKGEKYRSVNNNGIYIKKYDKEGNEVLYNLVGNKEQIQEALKATAKGFSVGSKDKVFVEDLITLDDKIIVISEMFRKNVNLTPKTVQKTRDLLTGKYVGDISYTDDKGKSPKVTFEIMDFILFEFDKDGKLGEIKPISKEEYNKITCYTPYVNYWGMTLAKEMYRMGWFDYAFTTENDNGEKIMVCKNNASPRKPELFFYTLDESYAQKKINLKQEGKIDLEKGKVSYFTGLRAQNGMVAVVYYQRKLRKITVNLESVN